MSHFKTTKKITKKTIVCSLVIVGAIIIPLLYSFFYLGAFWNPYSKLKDLPVAVVNLDEGAVIDGKTKNIGQELCDQLKQSGELKYIFTGKTEALEGTKGDKYYATIVIPKNFSTSIASAATTNKKVAALSFTANEKRNYLATQILKNAVEQIRTSLTGKVDGEIVSQLCSQLSSTPKQLTHLATGLRKLADGSGVLYDGANQLAAGTGTLKSGMGTFHAGFSEYAQGVNSVENGSVELLAGVTKLDQGIDALTKGASNLNDATANIDQLKTNAALLATKTQEFNQGLQAYTQGVDTLIDSTEQTATFLKNYAAANPNLVADQTFSEFLSTMSAPANLQNIATLKQYTQTLKDAFAQIAQGTAKLSDATSGIPELKQGIEQLTAGLQSAQSGSNQVVQGTGTLAFGTASLSGATSRIENATTALADGVNRVDYGATTLTSGTAALKSGITTATNSVISASADAKTQLAPLDGLDNYVEAPITTNNVPVDPVPNYGTAFAPYFLSLSLWVGALIIFFAIYLDADAKFNLLSRNSNHKLLRSFAYLLIGLIQAVLLGIILKVVLGLTVEHLLLYYGACCLVSLVFISIVQFLLVFMKDIGKFLSIALLILQLTSCGGTFPMETVPKFFQILYPFMPMTYSVNLLKEAISSTRDADAGFNLLVLGAILTVFMTLTIILSLARKTRNAAQDDEGLTGATPMILVPSSHH